jgi:hypothetical protein
MGNSAILLPTWLMAGAGVINLIVLGAYAWFTWGIWSETQRSARRTEELAKQARDTFKLQVLGSYLQSRATAIAFGQPPGSSEARAQAELDLLEGLFRETFPDRWKEINAYREKAAREKGPYVSTITRES